jgi:predicted RNase H-like HicB family nuclease/uncharacterized damage-inducible protein DinB
MKDHLEASSYFNIYIETNAAGRTMIHIPQLPGCIVRAASENLAIDRVEDAIHQHIAWQKTHAIAPGVFSENLQIVIKDRFKGDAASGAGSRVALLPGDRLPIDEHELLSQLNFMQASRADLLDLVRGISDEDMQYAPTPKAITICEILRHMAGAEQWYLARLGLISRCAPQKTPIQRLQLVREKAYQYLSAYDLSLSGEVIEKAGESWTLRKVLRRFLEHERQHLLELECYFYLRGQPRFPAWMSHIEQERELRLALAAWDG